MKQVTLESLGPTERKLVEEARRIRERAYAPYSHFKVGACLVDETGQFHTGVNVEGADYTLTTHAEASALNAMVKSGVHRLKTIAVVVKSHVGHGMPCGLCRQKIREFAADGSVGIIGVNLDDADNIREIFCSSLEEIFPYSFGPEHL